LISFQVPGGLAQQPEIIQAAAAADPVFCSAKVGCVMSSLDKALEALRVMQDQNSTSDSIKAATVWLEEFQSTPEAWTVCDQATSRDMAFHLESNPQT